MTNILCDQCVNRDVIVALRETGFNVIHTSEVKLSRASDIRIFEYAHHSRRILLTFDHDFGNITRFPIRDANGVVLVYIAEIDRRTIVQRTLYIFESLLKNRQAAGSLIIVKHDSIRIWPKK